MKMSIAMLSALASFFFNDTATTEIYTAPEQPITINMNVKIEHEIHIKVDKDVEELLKSRSDLF